MPCSFSFWFNRRKTINFDKNPKYLRISRDILGYLRISLGTAGRGGTRRLTPTRQMASVGCRGAPGWGAALPAMQRGNAPTPVGRSRRLRQDPEN